MRSGDDEDNLEDQIAKEIASMKRPRKEQRFGMCLCNQGSAPNKKPFPSQLPDKYALWYDSKTSQTHCNHLIKSASRVHWMQTPNRPSKASPIPY